MRSHGLQRHEGRLIGAKSRRIPIEWAAGLHIQAIASNTVEARASCAAPVGTDTAIRPVEVIQDRGDRAGIRS